MNSQSLEPRSGQPSANLAVITGKPGMTADSKDVVAQVRAVQEIMRDIMRPGVHYGEIPGTDKPSLYKQGSEVLLSAFRISVEPVVKMTLDPETGHATYQVDCIGRHITTNLVVGIGVGEASTAEEKYAYRAAICDAEYDDTPANMRRTKWFKGRYDRTKRKYGEPYSVKQVRTNPADHRNTVLKMAKKRAQIDLTLTALAASDMFAQDLEDLPDYVLSDQQHEEGGQDAGAQQQEGSTSQQPASGQQPRQRGNAPAPEGGVTDGQIRILKAKLESSGKAESELLKKFKLRSLDQLPKAKLNEALDWASGKAGGNG